MLGRLNESAEAHLAALAAGKRLLPPSSDFIMQSTTQTANALTALGRLDEAEALIRPSIDTCVKYRGPDHENTLWSKYSLANTLAAGKKFDQAKALLDEIIDARTRLNGRGHARTLVTVMLRAEVLERRGDTDAAEGEYREVLRGFGTRRGVDTFRATTSGRLAAILVARNEFALAEQLLEQQILLVDKTRAIALLRELDAVYDQWPRHDRSVDTTTRREAVQARLNALAPESSR